MGPLVDSLPVMVSVRHAEQRPPRRSRRPGLFARLVARARAGQSAQPVQSAHPVRPTAEPARSTPASAVVPTL
jgi:hypothetical protein